MRFQHINPQSLPSVVRSKHPLHSRMQLQVQGVGGKFQTSAWILDSPTLIVSFYFRASKGNADGVCFLTVFYSVIPGPQLPTVQPSPSFFR